MAVLTNRPLLYMRDEPIAEAAAIRHPLWFIRQKPIRQAPRIGFASGTASPGCE